MKCVALALWRGVQYSELFINNERSYDVEHANI